VIPPEEQRHVEAGSRPGEHPGGIGKVTVVARCAGNADLVSTRACEVLRSVLEHAGPPWPSPDEWRALLPEWFVEACRPEESKKEAEAWLLRWRALPPNQQAEVARERSWTLTDWLYWLEPNERQWFWWDAVADNPDRLRVLAEISGWPAPLGALEWLLRASGAVAVTTSEPTSI